MTKFLLLSGLNVASTFSLLGLAFVSIFFVFE